MLYCNCHSKSRLSGPPVILKSHHILKPIFRAYLIFKTGSGSKKTTGSTTLSFIITNKIRNPQTGSKQCIKLVYLNDEESDLKLQRMRFKPCPY